MLNILTYIGDENNMSKLTSVQFRCRWFWGTEYRSSLCMYVIDRLESFREKSCIDLNVAWQGCQS